MKHDKKNILKLQISTYLESSLSMIGEMMQRDLFDHIDNSSIEEAEAYLNSYYEENIFETMQPYLEIASNEYETFRQTPEGQAAFDEMQKVLEEINKAAEIYEKIKNNSSGNDNEGNGNVH